MSSIFDFDSPYDSGGVDVGSASSLVGASVGLNAGWAFDTPKTAATATTNAIQSQSPNTDSDGALTSFWSGLLGSVVKTGAQVYAAKNGVVTTETNQPAVAVPPSPNRNILIIAAVIGVAVVLVATHKG